MCGLSAEGLRLVEANQPPDAATAERLAKKAMLPSRCRQSTSNRLQRSFRLLGQMPIAKCSPGRVHRYPSEGTFSIEICTPTNHRCRRAISFLLRVRYDGHR